MDENMKRAAKALVEQGQVLAEAIKSLGEVPSGTLYANVMPYMSLDTYNFLIKQIEAAGFISTDGHLLKWIGREP